jgi:hypothetical protein
MEKENRANRHGLIPEDSSLRWHYPDQVPGVSDNITFSAVFTAPPNTHNYGSDYIITWDFSLLEV